MTSLPTLYQYYTEGGITAGLSADQTYFTLNKKNITLYSGALHYFRIPQEYWRDRLTKLRAAGLNAVETYVPWNLHELYPGTYDFGAGGTDFQSFLDIVKFLKIAQEEDLFAIVRPGPYICSEWEFGGMPGWLLRDDKIKLRTSDPIFMGYVTRYFKILLSNLVNLQFKKGGPIIAFQIENEYGNTPVVGSPVDTAYLEQLKNLYLDNGITELLFTSDTPAFGNSGSLPGILNTANFQDNPEMQLDILKKYQPDKPLMVMEFWTGWFDHWTEEHHTWPSEMFADVLERILKYPSSVNFYMFHGGTSFGFMNGANIDLTPGAGYQPDISCYDYDAPLTESGNYTTKYNNLKEIISRYNQVQTLIPDLPTLTEIVAYAQVPITQQLTLAEMLSQVPDVVKNSPLLSMEKLPINNNGGQMFGYIVYRKLNIDIAPNSVLKIGGHVCDTVIVLINGKIVSKILETSDDLNGFGYWKLKDSTLNLGPDAYTGATLELLVENWSRNNFGKLDTFLQYKGLWQGDVSINGVAIPAWDILPLEFKKSWTNGLTGWHAPTFQNGPALYKGILKITERKDTFVDMRTWNTGVIIANGFVLSRYLKLGPQQTAYLPAPLLKVGDNDIVIFENFVPAQNIQFSNHLIFETPKKSNTTL